MPGVKDYKPNTYSRPVNQVLVELRDLQTEFEKAVTLFTGLCNRFEQCARNINSTMTTATRDMFKAFMDRGCLVGGYIRFTDTKTPEAIYQVTGVDAEGFWIRLMPDGDEYHLKLFAHADRLCSIRRVRNSSYTLRKMLNPSGEVSIMETGYEEKVREEAASNYHVMNASADQKNENDQLTEEQQVKEEQ